MLDQRWNYHWPATGPPKATHDLDLVRWEVMSHVGPPAGSQDPTAAAAADVAPAYVREVGRFAVRNAM